MIGNSRFRQRVSVAAVALLGIGAAAAPSVVSAAGRVALVVGNSDYAAIGALPNPGNDAADVAAALRRLGFDVTPLLDAERVEMNEALRTFTRESVGADVALVFYAGHGLEMDGVNYLVPVDARLERDTDVRFEAVELDDVLAATAGAALRVVILDACRNNPLARSMQRTSTTRNVSRGSFGELDENLLGDETLVAYAAAAGTTAADGAGRNSPYTTALLEYLEQPLEIGILFREVRARVLQETSGEQRPHEYASLLDEHYLRDVAAPATVVVAAGASADALAQQETVFWQSIEGSRNPADFEAYLRQYPSGAYRSLATNRMAELRALATEPSSTEVGEADAPGIVVFRDCDDCPEMVVIPAGRFQMGCVSGRDCAGNERPVHDVEVATFALSKYELTIGEYNRFASDTYRYPEGGGETYPVILNSGTAWQYARWLSDQTGEDYRLPSEAEWEYAARAGTVTRFYWGNSESARCERANGDGSCDGFEGRAPVGSFSPNGFGLHDMAGNVWEMVADCWHGNYRGAPSDGSAWRESCERRTVTRGGGARSDGEDLRSANREPGRFGGGLRLAKTIDGRSGNRVGR